LSFVLVVLNSLMLGVQANYNSTNVGENADHWFFTLAEGVFCILFTTELILRIIAHGHGFLRGRGWTFNVMDSVLVVMNLMEVIMQGGAVSSVVQNLTLLRIVRICRLVRLIRLCRVLKYVRELRTIIVSIGISLKSLAWTVVLLLLLIYCSSLVVTHIVFEKRQTAYETGLDNDLEELKYLFGDLGLTMLSMFETLFGGQDWDVFLRPLMTHISPWIALPWSCYVAFGVLAMLNAMTGVFVENVVQSTKRNEEAFLVNNVRELFSKIPDGIHGKMDWHRFESLLNTSQMQEAIQAIKLELADARGLFKLLDADNSGCVCAEEFLAGCLRLRGPAKALDLAILHFEVRKLTQRVGQPVYHSEA